jgi:hypothetical protein
MTTFVTCVNCNNKWKCECLPPCVRLCASVLGMCCYSLQESALDVRYDERTRVWLLLSLVLNFCITCKQFRQSPTDTQHVCCPAMPAFLAVGHWFKLINHSLCVSARSLLK